MRVSRNAEQTNSGARRRRPALVLGFSIVCLGGCSDEPPPSPPQPIAFSHQAHAENDIGCLRCHQGAETQAEAGLPALSSCAVCHRRRVVPDHPEVLKFMELLENREPLVWRKVNVMPESGDDALQAQAPRTGRGGVLHLSRGRRTDDPCPTGNRHGGYAMVCFVSSGKRRERGLSRVSPLRGKRCADGNF